MRIPKKRCVHCRCWFEPDPRTAASQKFCSDAKCRRRSRSLSRQRWWRDNGPEVDEARRPKHNVWAKNADYWRNYRVNHPDYARRDNARRRRTHETRRRAANQDMSRDVSVGKLRDIQVLRPDSAANQDMIHRQMDGIVDYLLWKEGAANQDTTDLAAGSP